MAAADEAGWDTPDKVTALREAGAKDGLAHIFTSDEACLQRFLRARRGDVAKALAMLLEHQKWRREETPWWPLACCPLQHTAADWRSKKAYVSPTPDAEGSVVAFVQAALHDKNEARLDLKRFISFLNDEACARLDASTQSPKPSQMTIIVSFTGFGYSHGFDVSAGMLIIQTLSAHYPERLKRIVMTNTPFVFNAFWALVKVFLDERTSQKILFCKQAEIPGKLNIPLEQLPPFLGGSSSYAFEPEHVLGSDGAGAGSQYLSVAKGPMTHLPAETLQRAWEGLKEEAGSGGGGGSGAAAAAGGGAAAAGGSSAPGQ